MADRREDAGGNPPGHRNRRAGLIVLLALLVAVPAGITFYDSLLREDVAPDFTLTDTGYQDGVFRGRETFNLTDFRGTTVVLDFMAYNCGACRHVTPVLERVHAGLPEGAAVTFLSIDVGEFSGFPGSNNENLVRWQTVEFDSPWRHAVDDTGIFLEYIDGCAFGGIPCLYVLDAEGMVVLHQTGSVSESGLEDAIEASMSGEAKAVNVIAVGIVGLAFIAGVSSFFAPCSVGLIPAYMGFLLQRQNASGHKRSTLPAGLVTAAGIVSLYAVLAVVLWIFQDALEGVIPVLGPVVGGLLVLLGILMLVGFDWERVAKKLGMGRVDGRKGFFAFGVGYGLAAFGCTGPIFLPVLIAGFADGTVVGVLAFFAYALAVASFVVFAAYLVGAGQQTRLRALLSHTKTITRVSAVLLILAGLYLLWFDLTAFQVI